MAYAVCVTWIAKDGEEEAVAAAIGRLLEPSRAEPGVKLYVPHRDPNDPRVGRNAVLAYRRPWRRRA